jgi:predicted nucleic acid-binding protein
LAILIDTDLLIELEKGDGAVGHLLGEEDRAISVITVSELLHGVLRARGAARAQRQAFVEHLLAELQAIPITQQVARIHADIWSALAERGEAVGAHDLWIAATAIAHGLAIATRNGDHFRRIPGLRVISAPV